MVERYEDWPERMLAAIEEAKQKPFEWGVHDCLLYSADIVRAMTGHDYLADYRETYSTPQGALLMLRKHGLASIEDAFRRGLGDPLASVFLAQRGDIALFTDADGRLGAGICVGEEIAALSLSGLVYLPMVRAVLAWRV